MQNRILLLTGIPGIGKTTVILKVAEALKTAGVNVGGMISREVREGSARVGFEIMDLANNNCDWLAHTNQKTGPKIGKYHVKMEGLEKIGATAIKSAVEKCDVVVIDEIGPMELVSQNFKQEVRRALDSKKLVLAIVHAKAEDPLIKYAKQSNEAVLYTVSSENRDILPEKIKNKALEFLQNQHVT